MFQLGSVQVLSDVVVTFLRAIVLLTPNGQFLDSATAAFNELYQQKKQRQAFTFLLKPLIFTHVLYVKNLSVVNTSFLNL